MHQISLRIALAMIPALITVLTLFGAATAAREGEVIELEMQRDADAVAASVVALVDPEDLDAARERLSALDQSLAYLTIELAPEAPPAADDRHEVMASAPLGPDGGGPFVVVREPLAERDAFVRRALITDALGVLAATLMAFAFAVAVGRVLVQGRVMRLVDRLRAVGGGNYDAEPLALGQDEIGELGREVDQMTQQLRRARDHAAEELAARRRAQLQLRRADRLASVGRTVAVFAHEIGTPLAVVAGRAQRLERPTHSEKTRADARVIREQADRITGFVRRLLDFARHDDSLEFSAIPLGPALQSAQQLAGQRARAAQVTVVLEDFAPAALVDGDTQALVQVFTNLIHNAVDASPEGSTVRLVAREVSDCDLLPNLDSAHLHVTVEDEGPGIPEALRDRVFDPFFTTKPAGEGTGLGLSIVSEIVHAHGGRVTLDPDATTGCRIVVHLPISGSPRA
jgi:signal transduction histidine kinase